MRSVHTVGSTHSRREQVSPACLVPDTDAGFLSFGMFRPSSTFLPPFAPVPLQDLLRYYEDSDSWRPSLGNVRSPHADVTLPSVSIPSPTTRRPVLLAFTATLTAAGLSFQIRLRQPLAGSSRRLAESSSLRTDWIPLFCAPHPASRRRSNS